MLLHISRSKQDFALTFESLQADAVLSIASSAASTTGRVEIRRIRATSA
jgi:hypothetical protein